MNLRLKGPIGDSRRIARWVYFAAALPFLVVINLRAATLFPVLTRGVTPEAPPPPPPTELRPGAPAVSPFRPLSVNRYSIGDPTDEEQLYLELINRARANPAAQGAALATTTDPGVRSVYVYYNVDLNALTNQFNAIAPAPPLSFNAQLIASARLHSGDMFTNQFQGHDNSWDNGSPFDRITGAGYTFSTAGENVFAYAEDVFFGHAGFEVDWGYGPGGMQSPAGHRSNIHNPSFREIGIGVVDGVSGAVGPQLVTQDFGSRNGLTPFITGVAYYDLNGNGVYDPGEGIGGLTVSLSGSSSYAVTANSGGYSVPAPGNGAYQVTFSGNNLPNFSLDVVVSANANLKADYVPTYAPAAIAGLDQVGVNQPTPYTFSPVGAAASYEFRQARLTPFTTVEAAENDPTADFTANTSGGYAPIDPGLPLLGGAAFHLAHANPPSDQTLSLNQTLYPGPNSALQFASQLVYAGSGEIAQVQVSTNDASSWETVWSRQGTDDAGQSAYEQIVIPLSAYAGQVLQVRFRYQYAYGNYYQPWLLGQVGWYFDDIAFTDTSQLTDVASTVTTANTFAFNPPAPGDYRLQVRPLVSGRWLSYGPAKAITATTNPIGITIQSLQWNNGGQVQLDFLVTNGTGANYSLEAADALSGPWATDAGAALQTVTSGGNFRFTTSSVGASHRFYRVRSGL